ncbi:NAD(P)-binding protein [Aureobasidium pullulans]|uniref:NAD(P)-binding protein n=3 Tax=Aureobasidium pullulans TaxID=5580 RepID=A0A074X5V1_AURPU|nr:NAD(P)-binding protein [Aureobasidium pullulans EXF-150]THV77271.1 NAD(P)-binding protein [Aureobasidium pullulans]KEQ80753.1 NAD(P)-binding protein [Aureobasidium pullulans EXF-150]THV88183.1 NAD(P)-binding protein [Aureobasidium pullulans]THW00551.1 NAD(P)-binding protein [Aureobasidium pullulans]THW20463.1 NAD(P)-binding protein [Aureobasidium pullulans]
MAPLNVCMVGTGEYTTGFVGGGASGSDKKVGVVGLTLFDLRRRGKVGNLSMVGTSGNKFPAIREHLTKNISQVYNGLDTSFESYPANDQRDPEAFKKAIDALSPGDAITIFTPDPTHFPIAMYAIERGIHVMITKPAVKLLSEHQQLLEASKKHGVFVYIEHHKRFDPAYADARHRALKTLGEFNYFYSYMSQPKSQLETFKAWAGKESDISYYLNSHHIDVNESMVPDYKPIKVTGSASKGIATDLGCVEETEDTITLVVDWEKKDGSGRRATGVYTASWTAPQKAGVHSNQYFHYMASKGEVRVNQAKRGYDVTEDESGLTWYNPFYMKYAPDESGDFAGQGGYGYVSFEKFVDAIAALKDGKASLDDLDKRGLPTLKNTIATGAILEAGRRSLDENRSIQIVEKDGQWELK